MKEFNNSRFLKFCLIGVINTAIHMLIYNVFLNISGNVVLSHTIAFVLASLFSYCANAIFTYQEKMEKRTFYLAMLTFVLKLGINALLAMIFEMFFKWLDIDFLIKIIPLFITAILLPLQYLIFNRIFKKSGGLDNETAS